MDNLLLRALNHAPFCAFNSCYKSHFSDRLSLIISCPPLFPLCLPFFLSSLPFLLFLSSSCFLPFLPPGSAVLIFLLLLFFIICHFHSSTVCPTHTHTHTHSHTHSAMYSYAYYLRYSAINNRPEGRQVGGKMECAGEAEFLFSVGGFSLIWQPAGPL